MGTYHNYKYILGLKLKSEDWYKAIQATTEIPIDIITNEEPKRSNIGLKPYKHTLPDFPMETVSDGPINSKKPKIANAEKYLPIYDNPDTTNSSEALKCTLNTHERILCGMDYQTPDGLLEGNKLRHGYICESCNVQFYYSKALYEHMIKGACAIEESFLQTYEMLTTPIPEVPLESFETYCSGLPSDMIFKNVL